MQFETDDIYLDIRPIRVVLYRRMDSRGVGDVWIPAHEEDGHPWDKDIREMIKSSSVSVLIRDGKQIPIEEEQ
jgi:hypothetical protein